jgi:hypothetical protein
MKVYLDDAGERHLVGRADVPADAGPLYELPLFGPKSIIVESFTIGVVTHYSPGAANPVVERAVLLAPGQYADLLPGWQPLAS